MITKHFGGEAVRGGIYWSASAGEFISIPREGGKLAGGRKDRYIKAPLPIVLLLAPLMGLAFAIFLPLSGLLVLVPFLASKLRGAIFAGKVSAAHMAGRRLQPGVSYLESHPRRGTGEGPEGEQESKLVDLAQEIAEKRWKS